MNRIKRSIPIIIFILGIVALGAAIFIVGEGKFFTKAEKSTPAPTENIPTSTFNKTENEVVYKENGKPVIFLFSTTWCPHCVWIKDTFDSTVKQYVDEGKIVAYHWELDIKDNTLTTEIEKEVPKEHEGIYKKFNPDGYVPAFVFANQYYRVGNGYESQKDLVAEKAEFVKLIEEIIKNQ